MASQSLNAFSSNLGLQGHAFTPAVAAPPSVNSLHAKLLPAFCGASLMNEMIACSIFRHRYRDAAEWHSALARASRHLTG